jgi:hypothetical protein
MLLSAVCSPRSCPFPLWPLGNQPAASTPCCIAMAMWRSWTLLRCDTAKLYCCVVPPHSGCTCIGPPPLPFLACIPKHMALPPFSCAARATTHSHPAACRPKCLQERFKWNEKDRVHPPGEPAPAAKVEKAKEPKEPKETTAAAKGGKAAKAQAAAKEKEQQQQQQQEREGEQEQEQEAAPPPTKRGKKAAAPAAAAEPTAASKGGRKAATAAAAAAAAAAAPAAAGADRRSGSEAPGKAHAQAQEGQGQEHGGDGGDGGAGQKQVDPARRGLGPTLNHVPMRVWLSQEQCWKEGHSTSYARRCIHLFATPAVLRMQHVCCCVCASPNMCFAAVPPHLPRSLSFLSTTLPLSLLRLLAGATPFCSKMAPGHP